MNKKYICINGIVVEMEWWLRCLIILINIESINNDKYNFMKIEL
jgi:hypothetical protein